MFRNTEETEVQDVKSNVTNIVLQTQIVFSYLLEESEFSPVNSVSILLNLDLNESFLVSTFIVQQFYRMQITNHNFPIMSGVTDPPHFLNTKYYKNVHSF